MTDIGTLLRHILARIFPALSLGPTTPGIPSASPRGRHHERNPCPGPVSARLTVDRIPAFGLPAPDPFQRVDLMHECIEASIQTSNRGLINPCRDSPGRGFGGVV